MEMDVSGSFYTKHGKTDATPWAKVVCVCVSGYIEGLRRQIYHRTPKAKMVYVSGYIEGPGGKYTTGHLEPTWAVLKASGARQL